MSAVQRIASLCILAVLLTSCSSGSSTRVSCNRYWDGTVGTCLPNRWEIVQPSVLQERGVPGEVVIAFQAEESVSGHFPTVTVTREFLTQELSGSEYSKQSIQSVETVLGYKLIDTQGVKIDGEKVDIHIFNAQPNPADASFRFYQLSTIAKRIGYTFTVAIPFSIPEGLEDQILTIMESVTLGELQ